MGVIISILKIILPAITTGLFTFLVTKYTYHNNRPLEKLEIAYNRVYYPLYKLIYNNNPNIEIGDMVNKSKIYFQKYDKYIDPSTKKLFEQLKECGKTAKRKSIYIKLKNNILSKNSYLRRKLGYLESGLLQIYKYSMPSTKSLFRIAMEFFVIYLALILISITTNLENNIYFACSFITFLVFSMIVVMEIIWCFVRFLYYKIRK